MKRLSRWMVCGLLSITAFGSYTANLQGEENLKLFRPVGRIGTAPNALWIYEAGRCDSTSGISFVLSATERDDCGPCDTEAPGGGGLLGSGSGSGAGGAIGSSGGSSSGSTPSAPTTPDESISLPDGRAIEIYGDIALPTEFTEPAVSGTKSPVKKLTIRMAGETGIVEETFLFYTVQTNSTPQLNWALMTKVPATGAPDVPAHNAISGGNILEENDKYTIFSSIVYYEADELTGDLVRKEATNVLLLR